LKINNKEKSISAFCLIKKTVLMMKETSANNPKILAQEKFMEDKTHPSYLLSEAIHKNNLEEIKSILEVFLNQRAFEIINMNRRGEKPEALILSGDCVF